MHEAYMTRTTAQKAREKAKENGAEHGRDMAYGVREVDPKNYGQAVKCDQRDKWMVAMAEELQALEENGVWMVVVPPNKSHVLHTKWVYKTKTDADKNIERSKARLVV